MENQMTFEQKVKSLSAKEMVETMIKGIEREWVKINMGTFGSLENGICYGCAATNTICEIIQKPFTGEEITRISSRAKTVNVDYEFLRTFELAIDCLRRSDVEGYNECAKMIGATLLPKPKTELPYLATRTYKEYLEAYKQYASSLPNEKLID